MLQDILNVFKLESGYDVSVGSSQRNAALDYVNRGAKDLYNELDADAMMRETVLLVSSNCQMTLPSFIGDIKGLREYGGYTTFNLNEIGTPRFTSDTWKYKWRNFTLKGKQPLHTSITNASLINFTTNTVEATPATVVISGRTINSKRVVETLVMDGVMKQTVNSFEDIDSISSPTLGRTYNIVASDILGRNLATLYNTDSKTKYILVDVSRFAWSAQTGDGVTILAEVLYKPAFVKFYNDTDEFHADGFDDAIAYKATELWYHGQGEDKVQDALLFRAKAKEVIDNAVTNNENGENRKLAHAPNPVYKAYSDMKYSWGWRRNGRFGRLGGIY